MTGHYASSIFLPLAMLTAGAAFSPQSLQGADSEQVTKLLSEAKADAYQIREDASLMESYSQFKADWRTHTDTVNGMRIHINSVGAILTKLDDARGAASAWQITAIDRIKPLLRELAANTEAIIVALNKDPSRLNMPEYRDYIEANSDEASQLADLIANFVNYGNSKSRMERLANKLELPSS